MKKKIGLVVIATGKYDQFIPPLYKSVQKYFMANHDAKIFCFTDGSIPENDKIVRIQHEHEPWPGSTLFRYRAFTTHKEILSEMDYLFYCDADMRFVAPVGDEILPDENSNGLVGTIHPGFYNKNRIEYTYETNPLSLAYIAPDQGKIYFAGGFNGGTSEAFLKMSEILSNNIDIDLKGGIIAKWHDESHFNAYFSIEKPNKILDCSYCYPESWNIPFDKKLLALDKNHSEVRI